LSVDSNPSHLAWVKNIRDITGISIPFPIISDSRFEISKKYCMVSPSASTSTTVRNVFIIDDKQIIRAVLIYPLNVGRNIPEIFRLVVALQTADKEKAATPANWMPGLPIIVPAPKTYDELLTREKNISDFDCKSWYLCYKK